MKKKELKATENLKKLKDREIDTEALEEIAGGGLTDIGPIIPGNPVAKSYGGALNEYKPRIPKSKKKKN